MVKVLVFSRSYLSKDTNGASFCFLSLFGQGYQWWKFLFFLGHIWRGIPTVKVLVGLGHFWPRIPTAIVFVFHGHFWPRLLLLAPLAMNTKDESYVCDLRLLLSNLWHPAQPNASSRLLEAISDTPLCKEFELREATAGIGLKVRL